MLGEGKKVIKDSKKTGFQVRRRKRGHKKFC